MFKLCGYPFNNLSLFHYRFYRLIFVGACIFAILSDELPPLLSESVPSHPIFSTEENQS